MGEYRAHFPSTYESVGKARHALVDFARMAGFGGAELQDIESAIGEALANAAEHGHRDSSYFCVRAEVKDGKFTVDVKDNGSGFEAWNASDYVKPLTNAPRGFGIFIMRALMDRVEYSDRGSRVRMIKHVPHAYAAREQQQA